MDNVEHLLDRANRKDRVYFIYGDLCDYISIQNVVKEAKPDYVFHLAAQSYPQTSFTSPLDTFDTNIQGTERLLEALRHCSEIDPVIHVCASSEVYGRVPKERLPINEECTFHPASPYAISKVGTDLIGRFHAEAYGQKGHDDTNVYPYWTKKGRCICRIDFCQTNSHDRTGLIPPIIKVGNLSSLRTLFDVRDAVRAYYLLVTVNPIPGEYYNIGGTYSCTIGNMLNHLISLSTRKDITIEVDPARLRPIDADLQVPDTSKFKKHTGWEPQIPFEKTKRDLLNYWRERVQKGERFLAR